MAVTKYAKSGTAGALTVIAILIVAMAPLNLAPGVVTLDSLADDSVYINKSVVKQGEQFAVHFSPQILSEDVGIFYFVVDFHDNRGIYVIERETDGYIESSLLHAYNEVGQYTISVLALRGNISRIFAIPITVEPDLKEVEIQTSSDAVLEDEPITFNAEIVTSTLDNMEDYVWDLGDGKTKIGKTITHSYDNPGEYSVRLRAYTNDSVVYTDFTTVRITNGIPNVSILSDRSSAIEDESIEFNADVSDANSDLDTLQYIWSFGDGNYRTGPSVSHTYETSDTFTIALTVFDNDGAMGTAQRSFVVSNDPVRNAEIETVTKGLYEGESVISTVEVTESQTDLYSLQYDWNVAGIGKQVTVPYLDNGQFRHNVTVTDDDGASTFAESDLINIVNVNPIVALIGGETSYNLTISMWGTNTTQLNFTLFNNFRNATQIGNSTITSVDEGPTGNLESYTFYNIRQKLYEYWDILFYVNNATNDYENFVRMEFSFPDANNITLTQLCTGTKTCSATTWRQPISPLDLNFPLDLEFEYFDPSEDDLTLTVNFGDTVVETDIPSVPGEISTGTIEVSGVMSGNQFSRGLSYYIEDDDGGRSSDSTIPLADYSKIPPPEGYPNITSWARAGKFIKHYAPGLLIDTFEEVHENSRTIFQVETYYYESEALNYTWSMGDGNRYDQESPIHSFAYSGEYLIWVKVSDGFYESARYMWIEVVNNFQQFEPFFTSDEIDYRLIPQITTEIIESCVTTGNETVYVTDCYDVQVSSQGLPMEGKEFQFTLSGIYFDLIGTSNYEYMWDFGDGSVGYGLTPSHAYATSGDYEITIHVIDEHGFVQYFLLPMSIANSAPIDDWPILSEYNLVEGQHLYIPHVYTDSPTDLESLDYEWYIDGEVYTDPSLSVNLSHGIYDGLMIVTDADGAATNHSFSVTVEKDPLELTVSKIELYGPTDVAITAFGSVSPTVYNKDSYQNDTQISFTLSGRENEIFDTGMATHIPGTYSFSLNLNFSRLLTNATLLELEQQTQTIAEYHNAPDIISGKYRLSLQISDGQDVEQLDSAVNVLADQDGDMITDEFEFLMTNTLDDFTFSIFSSDTDENGISDSVEFLINDDEDQDGLPGFYEREIGSDPTKKDTDGDGLEDGWGSNGLGELVYQSDPTKRDTDDDGIEDLIEVIGWEVEIWAQSGVSVYMVNSDPVLADTDNDGLGDLLEQTLHVDPRNADSDGDGLEDGYEYNNSLAVFWWDSDNDTLSDGREVNGVDLEYVDEQGDTVFVVAFPSALIADSDDDGLLDGIEVNYLRSSPTSADTDQDSIPDIHELGNRTNIIDADTDNDGLSDGIELRGFEIPYYTLTNGEYDADGTVLKEPTMTNGTVYVTTDPTQWDTDGDGLSDGEEVLPDDERGLSNPRSIDSDGDGIPDKNDPFRLVSDYAPPEIVSGINLKYTSGALEIVETIVEIYTASLSAAWDILKGFGSLVTKLVKGVWKWKEVCFILCEDIPWIKSWRSIKSMATREIGKFLKDSWNSLKSVFTTITNELRDATKSFSMRSFDFDIDTDFWGIPNGISFSGILKMTTNLVRSFTAGIMDPEVEVRLTIIDDDIIDRIDVYQDNVLKKRIDVNSWFHFFYQKFNLVENGFTAMGTVLRLEIYDRAGNVKVLTQEVDAEDFAVGVIEQGIRKTIAIIDSFAGWAIDYLVQAAEVVVEAVEAVVEYVVELAESIANWILDKVIAIWTTVVRETFNKLTVGYDKKVDDLYDFLLGDMESNLNFIDDELSSFLESNDVLSLLDDTLGAGVTVVANELGDPSDEDSVLGVLKTVASFIDLSFLDGTILEELMDTISELLNDIIFGALNAILEPIVDRIVGEFLGPFQSIFSELLEPFTDSFRQDLPRNTISPKTQLNTIEGLIDGFASILEDFKKPSDLLGGMLDQGRSFMLNFLLSALGSENGDSMISFMKDITKPVFKIALIGYDLINDPGVFWEAIKDLFSFSPFTPLQSTLAIDLEPSQYNLRTAEWVRSIWTIVASIAQTLYGNLIAGKDLQGEIPPGQKGDDIQKENTKTERTIRDGAAINLIVWLVDILAFSPVHRQELKSSTFAEKTKFKLIDYLYPFASNAILLLSANEELDDGNSESDSLTAQSFISDIIHKLLGAVYAWIIFEEKGSDRKTSDLLEGIASTLDIFLAIGNEVFAYGFDFDPKGQKVWGVFQLAMEVLKGWKEISAVFGD